ncbi:MAG TPA: hypothetical protein VGP24_09855, partial [Glaciihabitans sp.]|nr:hypothetical protein [Glaciihabitans sp.]
FGFSNDPQDYRERVAHLLNVDLSESDGGLFTPDGQMVENHGMADNLMIEGGIRSRGHTLLRAEARPEDVWGDLTTFRLLVSQIAESV